jgi:hypothetical protein
MKHLFTNTNDTVIATSVKDAVKVWEEWSRSEYDDSYDEFEQINDEDDISITIEGWNGKPDKGDLVIPRKHDKEESFENFVFTAKAKNWAKSNKRSLFSSDDF